MKAKLRKEVNKISRIRKLVKQVNQRVTEKQKTHVVNQISGHINIFKDAGLISVLQTFISILYSNLSLSNATAAL